MNKDERLLLSQQPMICKSMKYGLDDSSWCICIWQRVLNNSTVFNLEHAIFSSLFLHTMIWRLSLYDKQQMTE